MLHVWLRLTTAVALASALVGCQTTLSPTPTHFPIVVLGGTEHEFCGGSGRDQLPVLRDQDGRIVTIDLEMNVVELVWPAGTTAQITSEGFVVIRDAAGRVIARQGDILHDVGVCPLSEGWLITIEQP